MMTHIYFINWGSLAISLLSITSRELNNIDTDSWFWLALTGHQDARIFVSLGDSYPESCILISLLPRLLSFTSCLGCFPEFSAPPASLPSLHTLSLSPTFAFSLDICGSAISFPHLSTKLQY